MNLREFITKKLEDNNFDKSIVYNLYDEALKTTGKEIKRSTYERLIRKVYNISITNGIKIDDILKNNVSLAKDKQKYMDLNRAERNSFRDYARSINLLEVISKELKDIITKNKFHTPPERQYISRYKNTGIIHFSDTHFNELIEIIGNTFDFTIASQRVRKHILRSIDIFEGVVDKVVVIFTGDLLNSDRRIDEALAKATNRSKAQFLAVDILQQALVELSSYFKVYFASVVGNEGRANEELGYTDIVASDNYDFSITEILKIYFNNTDITYVNIGCSEGIITINNKNFLCLHGLSQKNEKLETYVQSLMGRYALKGIKVDYVLFGHLHSCRIGDNYARSSSLCGSNTYSENALNLNGRASQNIFIVYENGDINGMRIDLQNTEGIEGYCIDTRLAEYNAKSANKLAGYKRHII
jgi:predicted phosphodiesterase